MDQEKIGKFIASLRKEAKMTQQELANKLMVTDRAVSNWENGRRVPDVSFFKPICEIFNISVDDLISGKRIENEDDINSFNDIIIDAFKSNTKKNKFKIRIISILLIIVILLLILLLIKWKIYYKKIELYKVSVDLKDELVLEKKYSLNNRDIYYYGVNDYLLCDKKDYCEKVDVALKHKQITFDELKSYYDEQYDLKNVNRYLMLDGGTTLYQDKDYTIMFCNTLEGNKDIYVGVLKFEDKLNGAYCGHSAYNFKNFIRTYKVLESSLDINDPNFVNIVIEDNKGNKAKAKIATLYNLIVGKTYEFHFNAYDKFPDTIKDIFSNATLMYTLETDKVGDKQINEKIVYNIDFSYNGELNEVNYVSIKIKDGTLTNKSATVIIKDYSDLNYMYGTYYRIDKKNNNKWETLKPINNDGFNSIGYIPNENDELVFNIEWENLYGKLESGYYRIVKEVIIKETKFININKDIFYISTEFEID